MGAGLHESSINGTYVHSTGTLSELEKSSMLALPPEPKHTLPPPIAQQSNCEVRDEYRIAVLEQPPTEAQSEFHVIKKDPASPTTIHANHDIVAVDSEEVEAKGRLESFVSSNPFEITFALLIVSNTLTMCAENEYTGWGRGATLDVPDMEPTSAGADMMFEIIGNFFAVLFTVELVIKLVALQKKFWRCWWNVFDFAIISFAWFATLSKIEFLVDPMLLRLLRLVRLLRLLRGLKALQVQFENLFLMVSGIKAAMPVLLWVVVLVFPMLAACALFLSYMLQDYMDSDSNSIEDRRQCFEYFGTFSKSMLSMFELTFGNWVIICRFIYSRVDARWAIFFMAWKLVVGIAVLRIIYGVFLHVTFACASADDESVINQKNRENMKYERKIKAFFRKFDDDDTGYISKQRFYEICAKPNVVNWLSGYLELDSYDVELLFAMVDDYAGDDKVSLDQLVYGLMKVKGTARSVDTLNLVRMSAEINQKLDMLMTKASR